MTVVICNPRNAVSAVKLGYPVLHQTPGTPGPIINWGMGQGNTARANMLNRPQVIAQTINKYQFLRTMSGRIEVRVPTVLNAGQRLGIGKWVIRPNEHSEGSDFRVIHVERFQSEVVPSGHHATAFIEPTREYRVWFYKDDGYLTAKRVPRTSEGQSASDECRSRWGYSFVDSNFDGAITMIRAMRAIIPIDFGAVDMLWHTTERQWYVLEVNSAPSLDHSEVLSFFKRHFEAWVASVTPERQQAVRQVRDIMDQETPEDRGESNIFGGSRRLSDVIPTHEPPRRQNNRIQVVTPQGLRWISGQFTVENA